MRRRLAAIQLEAYTKGAMDALGWATREGSKVIAETKSRKPREISDSSDHWGQACVYYDKRDGCVECVLSSGKPRQIRKVAARLIQFVNWLESRKQKR